MLVATGGLSSSIVHSTNECPCSSPLWQHFVLSLRYLRILEGTPELDVLLRGMNVCYVTWILLDIGREAHICTCRGGMHHSAFGIVLTSAAPMRPQLRSSVCALRDISCTLWFPNKNTRDFDMSSTVPNILELPLELFRAVLVQAILARDVKRALRLRLVNRAYPVQLNRIDT